MTTTLQKVCRVGADGNVIRARDAALIARVKSKLPADILLCSVVKAELLLGVLKSADPQRNLGTVTTVVSTYGSPPFDDKAAEHYARIRADLEGKGLPIGSNDYFIAAIALANNLTLVTHNTREFSRIAGLQLEDWQVP